MGLEERSDLVVLLQSGRAPFQWGAVQSGVAEVRVGAVRQEALDGGGSAVAGGDVQG